MSIFGVRKIVDLISALELQHARKIGFAAIFLIVSFSLFLNAHYIFAQYRYVDPFKYLSGALSRDEYIARYRREYPAMQYINANLPEDAKILFIHIGKRGYYCNRDYVLDMNFNRSMLHGLVTKSSGPEDVLQGITSQGITHLLIQYDIFDRWVKSTFAGREQELLKTFLRKHVQLLYFRWGYGVYRVEYTSP